MSIRDGRQADHTASLAELERLGTSMWTGYSFSWLGNLEARAKDGEKAERALEIISTAFTLRNSFHCNGDQSGKGYSKFKYRPFTLEGNFAAAAGSGSSRRQSFPAVPANMDRLPSRRCALRSDFWFPRAKSRKVHVSRSAAENRRGRSVLAFSGKELRSYESCETGHSGGSAFPESSSGGRIWAARIILWQVEHQVTQYFHETPANEGTTPPCDTDVKAARRL